MNICVYGAASDSIADVYKKAGEQLGEELARRGHGLVFGCGASGMMGASARGASRGGGHIIGVAPSFFNVDGVLYPECDEYVFTETMRERKQQLENLSDCFIISPGGVGTFDEFFQILTLKTLGQHDKPIILYNINGFWDNMISVIGTDLIKGFISTATADCFCICETPESVFNVIESHASAENT